MSVNIKFNIDKAAAQASVQQLTQGVNKQQVAIQNGWNNIKTNYMYYSQLSSIILNNLAKAAEGTAALGVIQGLQIAQTAIIGEIAVFQTAKQAIAAFASPLPGMRIVGFTLTAISAMLQASVAAALVAAIRNLEITSYAEDIARQMEAYNL